MGNENDTDEAARWPFASVTPETYALLPEEDRHAIERMIRDMIDGTDSRH